MLLNALVGEERAVVSEIPGTTRDSVDSVMKYDGKTATLIDTAGIRRKSVASDRFTPCGVVVTAVGGGAYLLDHDPGMNRKNAPPSHGAGSIYPNDRVGMAGCRGQKSGAGAVGRLPIAAAVSKPIIAASRNSDRHNDQEQKDDHEFSQGSGGSEGIGRRRSYKFGVLGTPVQRSHLAKIAQS